MSPCFFAGELSGDVAPIAPEDVRHALRALRLVPGDSITIASSGHRYLARLEQGGAGLLARILRELPSTEPRTRITLYQALPKGDRMDYVVQKCAEAGVATIVPCLMKRCCVEPDPDSLSRRLQRWRKISREAAMQAFRTELPQVADCISFQELCVRLAGHQLALVPWEEERSVPLSAALTGESDVAIVIGPEGGIGREELAFLPARPVSLGPRIFRTETAGLAATVMLLALSGDMEPSHE